MFVVLTDKGKGTTIFYNKMTAFGPLGSQAKQKAGAE